MLRLDKIAITQFKNYGFSTFDFGERIIGISGTNGSGKTNLLDAIHYLCFTKSYFSKSDVQSAYPNTAGFRIEGNVEENNSFNNLICILRENNKKEFHINKE